MSLPLLRTKLYIPPPRPHLVLRDQLLNRLRNQVGHPLTLVCAPAGFGKTTLVSAWIAQYDAPVAWLSLDEDDNDPTLFLTYVIAALQTRLVAIGETALALLVAPQAPPAKTILTLLLNELSTLTTPLTLVLDDYHVITAQPIHDALTFLIDHLPPHIRLILTSRIDPPLPLERWRVRNQLVEVRADDLRFTPQETAIFLNDVMGLTLAAAEIAALETRTEGWIAGLQLAALSMQGRAQGAPDVAGFVHAFSGSNRHVLSYLVEEVLNHRPPDTLNFLLQTSILDRMCAPLCDAITGETNGQANLAKLEQANFFLIPLDDEGKWYRYHHLFVEVLNHRLQQTQRAAMPVLHQHASEWYEQQALWSEAIHHALAAEDFVQAARIIEQVGIMLFAQTNIQHSLKRWLSTLPVGLIRDRPRLSLVYAWDRYIQQDVPTALWWVAEAEAALQRSPAPQAGASIAGEIAAIRAGLTAYTPSLSTTEALTWGEQALALLSPEQMTFRCIAATALGKAYIKQGDVAKAERVLAEANHMGQAAGNVYFFVSAVANQIIVQRALGALRQAQATCQEALAWVKQRNALTASIGGSLYLNLADLLREQNELPLALQHTEAGIAHTNQEINPGLFLISHLVRMRIKQAQGDWAQVWTLLGEVSALAAQHPTGIDSTLLPTITAQFQVLEAVAVRQSAPAQRAVLTAAMAWAQSTAWEEGALVGAYRFFDFSYLYEHNRIARAQVFIAWGRATSDRSLLHETLAYLERQRQIAETGSLRWFQIKIYLLQALAHHALSAAEPARVALAHALHLAQPEGFVRVFVDEGEAMRLLIAEYEVQNAEFSTPLHNYIGKLLAAFGKDKEETKAREVAPPFRGAHWAPHSGVPSGPRTLVDPLSARELEVLQLVAAGLSNTAIAAKLIVTTGTVKTHINHIFGKLGVESRIQAVVRARELGLLND